MQKTPIVIDCDPGHDDAIALILAFASEKLDVKAVTVTGGNQTLPKTLKNAKNVLSYLGVRPPLAAGADKPLCRPLEVAASVHGESGLDGPVFPPTDYREEPVVAIDLMRRVIMESDRPVTLVPTGPLTNIALLFSAYPEVKDKIERISLMGGGIATGNWSAAAEFNILVDPEAADIVFRAGVPIVMSPLDVTHKALILPEEVAALRKTSGKVAILFADLFDFFFKVHREEGFAGAPLHDPCAVAYLIAPELFRTEELHIAIETCGAHTTGMTLADRRPVPASKPNATVCLDIDREGFVKLLVEACRFYS